MNCELAQEDVVLSVYGELPDDRVHRLDQHLAQCERCRQEMEAVSALQKAMTALPIAEPSPSLLARTRLHLDEALDALPHGGFLRRMSQNFRRSLGSLQSAPVMATVLILAGVGGGGWGGYHAALRSVHVSQAASARNAAASVPVVADIDASQIAGVSSISLETGSENVEVRFQRLTPETAFGTLDDPQIRQLLLLGARNRANPVVHDD
ncbi:MAG: zf-HC2 domain-containing protein, partial [Acidobacteriaceae bacterium]